MTWTADHTHGSSKSERTELTAMASTEDAIVSAGFVAVQSVDRSHHLYNGVCLHCGAHDRRLYDQCQGRMAMD